QLVRSRPVHRVIAREGRKKVDEAAFVADVFVYRPEPLRPLHAEHAIGLAPKRLARGVVIDQRVVDVKKEHGAHAATIASPRARSTLSASRVRPDAAIRRALVPRARTGSARTSAGSADARPPCRR